MFGCLAHRGSTRKTKSHHNWQRLTCACLLLMILIDDNVTSNDTCGRSRRGENHENQKSPQLRRDLNFLHGGTWIFPTVQFRGDSAQKRRCPHQWTPPLLSSLRQSFYLTPYFLCLSLAPYHSPPNPIRTWICTLIVNCRGGGIMKMIKRLRQKRLCCVDL